MTLKFNLFALLSVCLLCVSQVNGQFIIGDAELLYTDAELPNLIDGSFATIKKSSTELYYFATTGWAPDYTYWGDKQTRHHGSLSAPYDTKDWDKTMVQLYDYTGWYTTPPYKGGQYTWAGFWLTNIYKRSNGDLLGFVHVEKHPDPPPLVYSVVRYAIGLVYSTDGGDRWTYCGEIIKPQDHLQNIGGVPYIVIGDYFYVYYHDRSDGVTPGGGQCVARAEINTVLNAAAADTVTPWTKYNDGSWTEDGLTGVGSHLTNLQDLHQDAAYCTALKKYIILTDNEEHLKMYTSADGVTWADGIIIDAPGTGKRDYYGTIVDINDLSEDCSIVDGDFYIMFPRKTLGTKIDDLYRRRITYDPTAIPDLVITDLRWSPVNPYDGQEVTFSVTVKNQSNTSTPAGVGFSVVFYVDSTRISWGNSWNFAPGETKTITGNLDSTDDTWTWTATAGTHTVLAHVDGFGENEGWIAESNEDNNTFSAPIYVAGPPLPDLIVTGISWAPPAPFASQEVAFSATIKNQGDVRIPGGDSTTVLFRIDDLDVSRGFSTSTLTAGSSVTIAASGLLGNPGWVSEVGKHVVSAHVDEKNYIEETHEDNNTLRDTIIVERPSNLALIAHASASQTDTLNGFSPNGINDGIKNDTLNGWANSDTAMLPQWVMLEWDSAEVINKTALYTDNNHALRDYRLQYFKDSSWIDIKTVTGNTSWQKIDSFPDVTTTRLRVYCMMGPENMPGVASIIELEVYNDPNISLSAYKPNEAIDAEKILIYPNPLDGENLTIELSGDQTATKVDIFSITGKMVYGTNLPAGKKRGVIKNATFKTSGLYLIRVQSAKKTEIFKLIVN